MPYRNPTLSLRLTITEIVSWAGASSMIRKNVELGPQIVLAAQRIIERNGRAATGLYASEGHAVSLVSIEALDDDTPTLARLNCGRFEFTHHQAGVSVLICTNGRLIGSRDYPKVLQALLNFELAVEAQMETLHLPKV